MHDGFVKTACAVPNIRLGDCEYNAGKAIDLVKSMTNSGVKAASFPELCVTGSTIGDLFRQKTLLCAAEKAVSRIAEETSGCDIIFAVGAPVAVGADIFDCAAVISHGELLALIPKENIRAHTESNEARFFSTPHGREHLLPRTINYAGYEAQFGSDIVFSCDAMPELCIGFTLGGTGENIGALTAAGASVIFDLAADSELIGKPEWRMINAKAMSSTNVCAYAYVSAGKGESTGGTVSSGHCIICENGQPLAQQRWESDSFITADIDIERITSLRRNISFASGIWDVRKIVFNLEIVKTEVARHFSKMPFVPEDADELASRCDEILHIQSAGLVQRMTAIGCKKATLGLSGGLDSTLALLVTVQAFDMMGLPRTDITAVTMPCFGTTGRTYNNSCTLARTTGVTLREINIADAVTVHLRDIGHDIDVTDTAYENAQARERTQVLMDISNMDGSIVVGTGDLSEIALGWSTYNGDHMSMYCVNCDVPKTLIRHLVAHVAKTSKRSLKAALLDVLDTPVSPELLPPKDGEIAQKTEDIVGPYELHDFFLYYFVRFGFTPQKIYRLARLAFGSEYDGATVKKWLIKFVWRFMTQQFKRNCSPDGPKVGSVCLSPHTDWQMPSDMCANEWVKCAEAIEAE